MNIILLFRIKVITSDHVLLIWDQSWFSGFPLVTREGCGFIGRFLFNLNPLQKFEKKEKKKMLLYISFST